MKFYAPFIHPLLLLVLFTVVFAGTFSSCTKEEELSIYATQEGRFDLNEDEYITMQVVTEEGTNNSSALLRFENHTEWGFYGSYYSLQYYNNNNWEPDLLLQGNIIWSGGYGTHPGETKEYGIDIIPYIKTYNNKKGMYKLSMTIQLFRFSSWWPPENEERIFGIVLNTEFEVK